MLNSLLEEGGDVPDLDSGKLFAAHTSTSVFVIGRERGGEVSFNIHFWPNEIRYLHWYTQNIKLKILTRRLDSPFFEESNHAFRMNTVASVFIYIRDSLIHFQHNERGYGYSRRRRRRGTHNRTSFSISRFIRFSTLTTERALFSIRFAKKKKMFSLCFNFFGRISRCTRYQRLKFFISF